MNILTNNFQISDSSVKSDLQINYAIKISVKHDKLVPEGVSALTYISRYCQIYCN